MFCRQKKPTRMMNDYRIRTYGKVFNKFWMKGIVIKYTPLEKSANKIKK